MRKKTWIRLVIIAAVAVVFVILTILFRPSKFVQVTIPPGLRKEEAAAILTKDMHWTKAQEQTFLTASSSPDYSEGVYFPDTYLIPTGESPTAVANRLISNFEEHFAPYEQAALDKNIKWTVLLTTASIIQREAASSSDMALISGIIWNRLNDDMPLDIDSTVQYARGDTPTGWWAPITPADLTIDSPYNTYLYKGLPPHPINSPGLDAINAALNPASTTCLYYIHDNSRNIHCSDTYPEQEANIKEYLQ
jgi:UPF0755 protein